MERTHSFGYWLRRRRKALDLTQAELAQRVSCSLDLIQKIEADARRPSRQLAEKLADSLGLDAVERVAFVQAARAERAVDRLVLPSQPVEQPLRSSRHNLPLQLTSFIGREKEIADIKQLLAAQRLTTLTGPGGTGKTRLALHVAAEVLETFPDGVWLVELALLADAALVPQAVASVLGLREDAVRPILATLTDFLASRKLLLIVDNCEHLVEACAQLAEVLLRACPNVRILASSREALGVAGEVPFRVPSLRTPDPLRLPSIETLTQFEAVRLFVERATAVLPGFTLTNDNAPALAQVCARLDGIPLAIELATARVNVLRVEQIATRLDDRFRLLTGGSRTAVPRQQTLRALIDWSYDLLSEPERVLLRRLPVFVGGWTLEVAEAVCAGDGIDHYHVLDLLTQLVNKSLVVADREQGQETRYRLLETIRQYALERLAASGEADVIRRRHAAYYLALAEEAEPQLRGAEQGGWRVRLEMEHDNLRGALAWAFGGGDGEVGLRLAGALGWFWLVRGYFSEGRTWLEAALAIPPDPGQRTREWVVARTMTLTAAGVVASEQGHHAQAIALAEEALTLFRELGDRHGMAQVRALLGYIGFAWADLSRATALLENALAVFRELGDRYGIAETLHRLGDIVREQGDYPRATALLEQSLTVCRELGNKQEIALVLNGLGDVAVYQGDFARAEVLYQQALSLLRELESKASIPWVLRNLGRVAVYQGDFARAVALLEESLARFRDLDLGVGLTATFHLLGTAVDAQGDTARALALMREGLIVQQQRGVRFGAVESLERFALLAARQDPPDRAARLLGAAEALRAAIGTPLPPSERPDYERTVAAARTQLDETVFAAAWAAGQALTLEQAIAEALGGGG